MKAELIDHMGSDLTVVNAARVSFDKEAKWATEDWVYTGEETADYVTTIHEKDKKLIAYLSRNDHFTPFTHCTITLRETVPIFVARQRFKHTIGFSYNEVSRRYVDDTPEFFVPSVWRRRAENVKQGSSDEEVTFLYGVHEDADRTGNYKESVSYVYECFLNEALSLYEDMIKAGVAPEQARMVLPQSMYTSYYVTGSLYAFARAFNLRSDSHAQKEIRDFSKQWGEVIKPLFPVSWEALTS